MSYLVSNVAMSILSPIAKEYTCININYNTKAHSTFIIVDLDLVPVDLRDRRHGKERRQASDQT